MEIFGVVVGVSLGFGLTEGKSLITSWKRVRALRRMVLEELRAIRDQIPQKKDIIEQIICNLNHDRILPGISVRAPRVIYERFFPEVSEQLNEQERNSVHFIYEYSRIIDDALEGCEATLREELLHTNSNQPYKDKVSIFTEILGARGTLRELISRHLAGKPIDVFRHASKETT